ncbi:MAG: hypothetical protein SPLUMA2_SPLUMAMAG2_01881 [uncultured Sulfurimonas sp.]|nr:MAG: hypothetical protein SPLUMA1_SPLUMAMAG1_01512 [uncultured Sulfurimonas sp.]CAI6152317.1 MAG: hypothetical protein SPLUMA2_SPLUMAMAG2_01881 [uncultured Sulfurimonas sp.]
MSKIFEYQLWHFCALVISITVFIFSGKYVEFLNVVSLFGIDTVFWLALALFFPLAHQLYVAIVWRLELYKNYFSSRFGWKKSFLIYRLGFSALFGSHLIFIIFLAYVNRGTLKVEPFWVYFLVAFIMPIVAYLFYSVKRYFTFERAYGIDHFDKNYNVPNVKQGIFRFTNKGMYVFGLLIFIFRHYFFSLKLPLLLHFLTISISGYITMQQKTRYETDIWFYSIMFKAKKMYNSTNKHRG